MKCDFVSKGHTEWVTHLTRFKIILVWCRITEGFQTLALGVNA